MLSLIRIFVTAVCEGLLTCGHKKRIGFTFLLMELGGFLGVEVARLMLASSFRREHLHRLYTGYAKTSSVDHAKCSRFFVPANDEPSYMKILIRLLLTAGTLLPAGLLAGARDTLGVADRERFDLRMERRTATKAYRMTFVAAPLVVGGAVMMSYDRDFRELRNGYSASFRHDYDDYLQYGPLALTWGMKACGVRSRSSWGRMIVSNAFAAGLMAATVNTLKYTVQVERPDGSTRNSFPSGHAATAFMAATILHKEYGRRSPWFSIAGYAAATATGVTRQLNNRHWMSDVMVGAGIGILTAELGYFLADLIYKDRGLNEFGPLGVSDRDRCPSFLALHVGCTTALGTYAVLPGRSGSFTSGPAVGIRGAWFATPYVGVGGRLSAGNMRVTIDDVAQNESQYSASAAAGPCFSFPFTSRWLVGTHLFGGYEYYKRMRSGFGDLGDRGGALIGTGCSMTYVAAANFGVRFSIDYDLTSPVLRGSEEWMHRLTFGLEACAMF